MVVLMGFVDFFIKTRIGNALGLLMAACVALMIWTRHVETRAAANATTKVAAQVTKATDTEHDRRMEVLVQTQGEMRKSLTALHQATAQNARMLKEIDDASHAHDGQSCLSADAVRRLRAIH